MKQAAEAPVGLTRRSLFRVLAGASGVFAAKTGLPASTPRDTTMIGGAGRLGGRSTSTMSAFFVVHFSLPNPNQSNRSERRTLVKTILASAALFLAATANVAQGQAIAPTILRIDVENFVQYIEDTSDLSMFATNQGITTPNPPRNFHSFVALADIVAVNGQPAKGTVLFDIRIVSLSPSSFPGVAIADTQRAGIRNSTFEILTSEGTPIGTIIATGLFAGVAPPGAPLDALVGNDAIVGGTGAFLGARGYAGQAAQTVPPRRASITEDPGNRRRNGSTRSGLITVRPSGFFQPDAIFARNLFGATPADAVSRVSSRMRCLRRLATCVASGSPHAFSVTSR